MKLYVIGKVNTFTLIDLPWSLMYLFIFEASILKKKTIKHLVNSQMKMIVSEILFFCNIWVVRFKCRNQRQFCQNVQYYINIDTNGN